MKFCEILRDLLNEYNLTQTELAKKLNIKPSQISEWLKEKANPGYDTLKNIASTLNVSADYLLGLEDDFGVRAANSPRALTSPSPGSLTEKEFAMLEAFRQLKSETQDFILRTAQSLDDGSEK